MSSKWERKVARNAEQINKQRKRFGQPPIGSAAKPLKDKDIFYGRSMILPLFLLAAAVFFATVYGRLGQTDALYWITIILYVLLALFFFFKRPYLSVHASTVATARFGREKAVPAKDIESIEIAKDYCLISFKNKRSKWVFSRHMNRYNTEAMGKRLREFAEKHNIPVK